MQSLHEEWRAVVGTEGNYEVSNHGRVRSVDRVVESRSRWGGTVKRRIFGRILKPSRQNSGYLMVCAGARANSLVHVLVAEAFIGLRPAGCDVNHIDGNKHNNCAENLEYCTRQENMQHARETGLWDNRGELNGQAKAKESQVMAGCKMIAEGMQIKDAAKRVGVSSDTLSRVLRGEKWRHLGLENSDRRRCKRLSRAQVALLVAMRKQGMTIARLANIFGIGVGSVHRHIAKTESSHAVAS